MKAALDLVLFLLGGIAVSVGGVVAGVAGACSAVAGGCWWWRKRKGRGTRRDS